jgi:hypothetical protein
VGSNPSAPTTRPVRWNQTQPSRVHEEGEHFARSIKRGAACEFDELVGLER